MSCSVSVLPGRQNLEQLISCNVAGTTFLQFKQIGLCAHLTVIETASISSSPLLDKYQNFASHFCQFNLAYSSGLWQFVTLCDFCLFHSVSRILLRKDAIKLFAISEFRQVSFRKLLSELQPT